MQKITIYVEDYQNFWIATYADLPWMQQLDPAELAQRHRRVPRPPWDAIARTVDAGTRSLSKRAYDLDDGCAVIEVSTEVTERDHQRIVQSFFRPVEAICADPGVNRVVNGRHRSWACSQVLPQGLLPVVSPTVSAGDSIPCESSNFATTCITGAKALLARVDRLVLERSPDFSPALHQLASRANPAPRP